MIHFGIHVLITDYVAQVARLAIIKTLKSCFLM